MDLIDLHAAPTVLRMQVLSTGECLFSGDDIRREEFETSVFSAYVRLNEERRGILDDVRARGSVYDVIINKAETLERCVKRIREVHAGDDKNLYENLTSQESILLNLQRA